MSDVCPSSKKDNRIFSYTKSRSYLKIYKFFFHTNLNINLKIYFKMIANVFLRPQSYGMI